MRTIQISDETYEKIKEQLESDKEKETTKFQIKTLGGEVLYEPTKTNIKDALEEAVDKGADLGGADLGGANLRDAYLRGAYLGGADLGYADLGGADLGGADFYETKFYGKGGQTKIKKNQVDDFFRALGIIVED